MRKFIVLLVVLGILLTASVAGAQTGMNITSGVFLCNFNVSADGFGMSCLPYVAPEPTATATPMPLPTNTPEPTATPLPLPTATNTPVATNMIDMVWHAPMAHGDRPTHEHGDAPPQWVLDHEGVQSVDQLMLFTHNANTPGETVPVFKHTGFKGWSSRFNGQDWYGVFHLDFNPSGRASRFHSYQLWAKSDNGAVSEIRGWMDFGVGNNTGPQVVETCGQDSTTRPIMLVSQFGCRVVFENWYARAGGNGDWAPDFGFNINPNYFAGGDINDPNTWSNTGFVRNLERRVEFAWYLGSSGIRPAPRGEFWTTQWGNIVSGANDPVCGTQRTYGNKSYEVLCIRQYIDPTLRPMIFPGNSYGKTFPGSGIQFPN